MHTKTYPAPALT